MDHVRETCSCEKFLAGKTQLRDGNKLQDCSFKDSGEERGRGPREGEPAWSGKKPHSIVSLRHPYESRHTGRKAAAAERRLKAPTGEFGAHTSTRIAAGRR